MNDATGAQTSPPVRRYRRLIGLAAAVVVLWGVVAYLVKPFPLGELKNAIEAGVQWSANRRVQSDG